MGSTGLSVQQPTLLVLRALKLGDLLVAVPALHALRRAFPGHRLVYAGPAWLADVLSLVGGFELLPANGLDAPLAVAPGTVDIAVNLHGRGPESTSLLEAVAAQRLITPTARLAEGRRGWSRCTNGNGGRGSCTGTASTADPLEVQLARPRHPAPWPAAAVVHVGAAYGSRLWPETRFAAVACSPGRGRP